MSAMSALATDIYLTTGLHPWEHDEPELARFVSEVDVSGGYDVLRAEMDQADWDAAEIRDCCGGVEPECYQHYRRYA